MKNRILLFIFGALLTTNFSFAQRCGTHEGSFEEQKQKYPAFYQSLESVNSHLEQKHENVLGKMGNLKTAENGKLIIPVVVHIVYEEGQEDISDAVVQEALDALNKNINGQSDKLLTSNNGFPLTPDVFAAVRGDANLEFRLAKVDPKGDLTNGINRVRSTLTNAAVPRDAVKKVSYWNSFQYFNIWVVEGFAPQQDGGTLLGYAQFPWTGSMSTDGVVLLSSEFKDVESTTLTHETGHWLGLKHIWGDAVCGNDDIYDTPTHRYSNGFGDNPGPLPIPSSFPYHASLPETCDTTNKAGEMFMNYMDYTREDYVTMFTKAQVELMYVTLDGAYDEGTQTSGIGYREYMCSPENIAATGVASGTLTPACTRRVNFAEEYAYNFLCLGGQNNFEIYKATSFIGDTYSWDFGDGTTDTLKNPSHIYDALGSYDVSLTISYDETTKASSTSLVDLDLTSAASYDSITNILVEQGTEEELLAMGATNINVHIDEDNYSSDSYWKMEMFYLDSLEGAFHIDTFNTSDIEDTVVLYINGNGNNQNIPDSVLVDNIDSIWVYIDGDVLSNQNITLLQTSEEVSDSSKVWSGDLLIDNLDYIREYNFYYDTTVLNILTFIDSTSLTSADSTLLSEADTSWFSDGLLNSNDSIRIYFAQFNNDTLITISINLDTTELSISDSLMYADADSVWNVDSYIGWVDTVRSYYGQHYYTKYNGYFADTLFYRGELEETIYTAYYEHTCAITELKEDFITINVAVSANNSGSYAYDFDSESDLGADWVVNNYSNSDIWNFNIVENTPWEWASGVSVNGNGAALKIDRDNLTIDTDALISTSYDLSGLSSPAIRFYWSGAAANTSPVNELNVFYSTTCGRTWKDLGSLSSEQIVNAGLYVNSFRPNANEWADTIMTKNQLKNENVRFKFEYVTNGNTNNFYLDNIQIGEQAALLQATTTKTSRLSVYPNPTNGVATIKLENLANVNVEVKLVNILGKEVMHIFSGKVESNYEVIADNNIDHLDKGIYFVRVSTNGDVIMTDKIVLSK